MMEVPDVDLIVEHKEDKHGHLTAMQQGVTPRRSQPYPGT
jgi:hypothetical protein